MHLRRQLLRLIEINAPAQACGAPGGSGRVGNHCRNQPRLAELFGRHPYPPFDPAEVVALEASVRAVILAGTQIIPIHGLISDKVGWMKIEPDTSMGQVMTARRLIDLRHRIEFHTRKAEPALARVAGDLSPRRARP